MSGESSTAFPAKKDEAGTLAVIHYEKRIHYLAAFQIYFRYDGSCIPWWNNIFWKGICFVNPVRGYLALK